MAADAAPAAVPDPHDRTGNARPEGPQPGLLASALAPVAPARPAAFTLDAAAAGQPETAAVSGASSAAYHPNDGTSPGASGAGTGRSGSTQPQSVIKAWLLAGAERWRKGAGENIKRLEVAKARAMAQQVKESRQVSEKRVINSGPAAPSGGASGGGKTGGAGGKGLDRKASSTDSGPKNSSGPSRTPAGAPTGKAAAARTPGREQQAGGKPGAAGGRGADKPAKPAATGGRTGGTGSTSGGQSGRTSSGGKQHDTGGKKPGLVDLVKNRRKAPAADTTGKGSGAKGIDGKPGKDHSPQHKPVKPTGPDAPKTPDTKKPGKQTKDQPGKAGPTSKDHPASKDAAGKPFTTRESRITGYRDGTRAAKTTAHIKAYRDGIKDGWTDVAEAAQREKTRLERTHEARKQARTEEKPVPGTPSSADYHQPPAGPQPIGVKNIDASHLHLGDGAARESLTRGEVRSLKSFERRLTARSASLTKVAEETRGLTAHADAQAAKATRLAEDARSVKGGDKLLSSLAKLEEAAKVQAARADEVHKRAVRAADACKAVLANVETRYGALYQAVVDSPETAPAETHFYLGDHRG